MGPARPRLHPEDGHRRRDGQFGVIYAEELHWGCAGIALAIQASSLAAAGHRRLGHARADRPLGPRVLRPRRRDQARRLRGHRGRRRLRRQVAAHHRQARRRRVGPQRHQGLHLQRRHRRRHRRRRERRRRARPPRPGVVHRREGHARLRRARRRTSSASAPRRPPRSCSRTAASRWSTCSAAWTSSSASWSAPAAGERGGSSNALATFEVTRPLVGASALGIARAAYEWTLDHLEGRARRDGDEPLLEQQRIQQVLADVSTEIDAARLLVQRAAWMGRNGIPMTGGQGSMSKLKAGDVTMWATTTLMDIVGPEASLDRPSAREVVPRRQDLPAVRGHGAGPAARHLAHAGGRAPAPGARRPRPPRDGHAERARRRGLGLRERRRRRPCDCVSLQVRRMSDAS